ncbi:PTS sugar transporter subunit IIB [Photobacterium alginatilyticum]|uniref:PTS EIIB type-3 domain-containing protein n=1 Tax=Photobacterium alginatilyticum TaxID=1775171 RepID=A0ABW9YPX4_9GAMM|nr:hypothetical protein [Photobacterium alginatilyticum]NBI55435.1 hypothetical protein [Photobacterium alginatilyticum]
MSIFFDRHLTEEINGRRIISIVCGGGLTSSMMAQRMQKFIDESELPYYVMYSGIPALEDTDFLNLYADKIEMVYVSPQVHHSYQQAKESMASYNIPVFKIEGKVFGTMDYKRVVSDALACIRSREVSET